MRPMQQRAPGGATRLAMDVEIHAQQDERPEDHCEDRGPDQPKAVEVAKVVVRRRDEDAHDQVDEAEQVDAQQTHGCALPSGPKAETAATCAQW